MDGIMGVLNMYFTELRTTVWMCSDCNNSMRWCSLPSPILWISQPKWDKDSGRTVCSFVSRSTVLSLWFLFNVISHCFIVFQHFFQHASSICTDSMMSPICLMRPVLRISEYIVLDLPVFMFTSPLHLKSVSVISSCVKTLHKDVGPSLNLYRYFSVMPCSNCCSKGQ